MTKIFLRKDTLIFTPVSGQLKCTKPDRRVWRGTRTNVYQTRPPGLRSSELV